MRDTPHSVMQEASGDVKVDVGTWLAERAADAWQYDYFAVMRRLESVASHQPRWGKALRPSMELVRVGHSPSLSFAPASFSAFEAASHHSPPRLRQYFFGFVGANAPLPGHLSDFVRERALNHGDPTLLAFLDSLMHRFALQFYRAWAQARPVTGMDRPDQDIFRKQIGAFVGIGGAARQERDEIHDDARLHFSGWLARRVRNAESVEAVIGAYFGVTAKLERWVGHWMDLPRTELTRLGSSVGNDTARALGLGAVMGQRVWDRQHRVRLHLGPLTLAQYRTFLPARTVADSGNAGAALSRWMQQLLGDEYEWDAQLVLSKDEVPPLRLGSPALGKGGNAPRLGWVSWLGSQPRERDAADVRLRAVPQTLSGH